MIKLIATDLDNTLLDRNSSVPQSTIDLISLARTRGVRIAVVTGRSYPSAKAIASLLGDHTPVICYNGSMIVDAGSTEPLYSSYVDHEVVDGILEFAKANDIYVQMYDRHEIVVEKLRLDRHPDPDFKYTPYREVGDFNKIERFNTPKMLLAADAEQVPMLQKELESMYGDRAYFAQSEPYLIEVMAKGTHKGQALKFLADTLGITKDEIMACGDNTNDLPLLAGAGVAVAVANAVPALKDIATYICESERSEGFNEAVCKFVLSKKTVVKTFTHEIRISPKVAASQMAR